MRRFLLLILISVCLVGMGKAQWPRNFQILPGEISGKDTIPQVELPEVQVYSTKVFKNKAEEQQYWRLVRRVKKVLPYAKEAGVLFRKYVREVPADSRRRDKRIYVKKAEDELMAKYGPVMKKMSVSDGRVLIKLIDRETNWASYDIIQEVKGSVPAVFWQGIARIFGNNLKAKYDPLGEDRQIETIIQLIESGIF